MKTVGRLRADLDAEFFIWRPILAKLCSAEAVIKGDISLTNILKLNALLDMQEANTGD